MWLIDFFFKGLECFNKVVSLLSSTLLIFYISNLKVSQRIYTRHWTGSRKLHWQVTLMLKHKSNTWNTRLLKKPKMIYWHCLRVTAFYKSYDPSRMLCVLLQLVTTVFTNQHQCRHFNSNNNNNSGTRELLIIQFKDSLIEILPICQNWVEVHSICKMELHKKKIKVLKYWWLENFSIFK